MPLVLKWLFAYDVASQTMAWWEVRHTEMGGFVITRYRKPEIEAIWSDKKKLSLWEISELAAIRAQEELGNFPPGTTQQIDSILEEHPIDTEWWLAEDVRVHHDLIAFVNERLRFLPKELQQFWHKNITSFDIEDPALARMLKDSMLLVRLKLMPLMASLKTLALRHRYTLMMARTHGQGAEAQSFGKMVLTWFKEVQAAWELFELVTDYSLRFSKMSGAAGNYGGLDPEVEKRALQILGFLPFYGASQIMPRVLYAPLAQGLANLVSSLHKIGQDIRLKARSPRPLLQEPFQKTQQGSSAMPHKKNPIRTEQLQGMARLASKYASAIAEGIPTWEERSIEQSCVERVAWPDLFHVVVHSLEVLTGVISNMPVYADNMLLELLELRGCYAAAEAKEKLKELGEHHGLSADDAYGIVQLAAFNIFAPYANALKIREQIPQSLEEAADMLKKMRLIPPQPHQSIECLIASGDLHATSELSYNQETVTRWNDTLKLIFSTADAGQAWADVFDLTKLLKHEAVLFQKVFGV